MDNVGLRGIETTRVSAEKYSPRATMPSVKGDAVQPERDDVDRENERSSWWTVIGISGSLFVLTVVTDQATKALMTGWLGPDANQHRKDLLGSVLGFEFVRNTGVAFGMLQGRQWLVSILAIIVLSAFLLAFWREIPSHRLLQVGVGLIVGGALGNLVDRFRLGYVVDFVAVGSFPRFNVADSAITVGLLFLCAFLLFGQEHDQEPDQQRNRTTSP